jgi:hypothetical protein
LDYQAPQSTGKEVAGPDGLYPIAVYHIQPGPKAAYVVAPETGFVPPQKDTSLSYEYAGSDGATLELLTLPGAHPSGSQSACFQIRTNATFADPMTIRQGSRVLWSGNLTSTWQTVNFGAPMSTPLEIHLSKPTGFFLHDLGC